MRIRVAPAVRFGLGCLVGSLAVISTPARAQTSVVRGVVVDSAGHPVTEVALGIVALHRATRTDDHGLFVFTGVPKGDVEISVRRIGYEPSTINFAVSGDVDSVHVTLNEIPEVLSAINVSASERHRRQGIEDFYWRRMRGVGTYFTRDEMQSRRASVPSDVLRNTPGVHLVRAGSGRGVRFSGSPNMRNGCVPLIWIDGQRAPGLEVDDLSLGDLEGIELYNGAATTPPQFWLGNSAHCGTIVVWSRVPGD